MEYLAIFDPFNQPLHQNLPRREVHLLGHWHRTSQIYVLHPEKGYLCHRRSPGKDLFPSLWDVSIGGHLSPDETYESCALRELAEELGIDVHPDELELVTVTSVDGQDEKANLLDREHVGIFLYKTNLPEVGFKVQEEEITEIEYLDLPQLRDDLQSPAPSRAYIPMQHHFLEILNLLDAHQKGQKG